MNQSNDLIRSWRGEAFVIALIAIFGLLVGFILDAVALVLMIVLAGYLGWHFRQIIACLKWILGASSLYPPQSSGVWGEIFYRLYQRDRNHRNKVKALVDTIKQYQATTTAINDAVIVLGSYSQIIWFNRAAEFLFGLNPKLDMGQRVGNLIRFPEFVHYEAEQKYDKSLQIPSPVDPKKTLEVSITPYAEGRRLLMARDVTQVRKLEQMRRDFVANVSHELNTPLTVMRGYIETIAQLDNPDLAPYQKYFQQMEQQSQRMHLIVKDLLTLSKLESAASTSLTKKVKVAALIDEVIDEARALSGEQNHQFDCDIDKAVNLYGSKTELRSAFSNLVFNAVRYTPAGGKIVISWHKQGDRSLFSVQDTGIGIALEHIGRLTERFYRVDSGRARDVGGTGLGLSIVKHVAERHQGKLLIQSTLGEGSTFSILFEPVVTVS